MATLLENWRNTAYGNGMNKQEQEALWQKYFALEKGFYEEILKDPKKIYEGSVKELAEKFSIDPFIFVGILDGIDESLAGYHNPIDTMEEDTVVKLHRFRPEFLRKRRGRWRTFLPVPLHFPHKPSSDPSGFPHKIPSPKQNTSAKEPPAPAYSFRFRRRYFSNFLTKLP